MKKMRKKLLAGLAATFALSLSMGFSACDLSELLNSMNGGGSGNEQVTTDFKYELIGDSYAIAGRGTDDSGILEFPSEFNGKPVTAITAEAFRGDNEIGIIYVPDSITTIGEGAFYNCVNLEIATFGSGLEEIAKDAFKNCVFLGTVTFSGNLVTIGESAFQKCNKLKALDLPDTVTTIGDYAFYDCSWLKTVDFSTSLETIGDQAFANCTNLEAVVIPDGAPTVIGSKAFTIVDDATGKLRMNISRIEFGDSVISVGANAFYGNSHVRKLVLGDSMQLLEAGSFNRCSRIFSITVGAKVPMCETKGSTTPFTGCDRVREIIDGSGTLRVGDSGFGGILADVWSVKTPDQESSISIDETSRLVYYMGGDPYTKTDGAVVISSLLDELDEAKAVVIPETYLGKPVTSIATKAFYNDNGVKSFETGNNCQYIGLSAFQNAYKITTLKLGAGIKTIAAQAFMNTNSLAVVYFNCGTNLTSVGNKAFYKKRGANGVELAGVAYSSVYFKGTEAQWNTFKTTLTDTNNEDLFAKGVTLHLI